MKSVYIAGSRKFYDEIEEVVKILENEGVDVKTAGKWDKKTEDTLESEKDALLRAFDTIDNFDIVYVYSKDGYVGKTVAMEIAYAYARKKKIFALKNIEELSAQGLVDRTMSRKELIDYCKGR